MSKEFKLLTVIFSQNLVYQQKTVELLGRLVYLVSQSHPTEEYDVPSFEEGKKFRGEVFEQYQEVLSHLTEALKNQKPGDDLLNLLKNVSLN